MVKNVVLLVVVYVRLSLSLSLSLSNKITTPSKFLDNKNSIVNRYVLAFHCFNSIFRMQI
ncbi:hypothetical protein M2132_000096 [Dysgonomonas sp. PH5-45]|nr:hypothetical protein [Dysgonomonas sp. PH5-45]